MDGPGSAPIVYDLSRGWTRSWEKVVPEENVYRYYLLSLEQNLWGEWELIRRWGRIGQRPTRALLQVVESPDAVEDIAARIDLVRRKRGYVRRE
jgi:predicted DNA-binding WGR domain protein